jgi:endonuclease/exonuclease/phosphatase (EEP) superfamily protein YafD
VLAHLALVLPAVTGREDAGDGAPLRVVVANLYVLNPDPARAGRAVRALDADVVVVPELSLAGLDGLRASGLLDDLPYSVARLGAREETVGLFSRLPLADVTTRSVGGRALPRANVEVGGRQVRLVAAHPLPPLGALTQVWRDSLLDLADEVEDLDGPTVVLGDFNADRDHEAFRAVLDAGYRDAHDAVGRGLARTWPATLPLLHLDHVLVDDGLRVERVREVEVPGSDHLGVVADLRVS